MVTRMFVVMLFLAVTSVKATCQQPSTRPWKLVEELRIGSANGPDDSFGNVRGLLPDDSGGILVLQTTEVRWYSQAGKLLKVVGRQGKGPGEFIDARGFGWLRDTLWVRDTSLGRITLFYPAGTVAGTIPFNSPILPNVLPTPPDMLLREDRFIIKPNANASNLIDGRTTEIPVFLCQKDGTPLDTLAVFDQTHELLGVTGESGTLTVTRQPFNDSPLLVALPNGMGLVIVHRQVDENRHFTVEWFDSTGEFRFEKQYAYAGLPLNHKAVQTYVESMTKTIRARFQTAGLPTNKIQRGIEEGLYVPAYYPPISLVFGATNGTVWLGRERPIASGSNSREWWALDNNGRLIGRVKAPLRADIMAGTADVLWAIERDHVGIPYVVRYRIVR